MQGTRTKLCCALALVLAFPLAFVAQTTHSGQGFSRRPPDSADFAGPLPVFAFHSGMWFNLHHFLYQESRKPGERPAAATPEEKGFEAAIAHYKKNLAGRDLLFDGDMVAIKNRLAELEGVPDLAQSGLKPDLIAALQSAAPLYRARWWTTHDQANRAWVEGVTPLIRRHGGTLAIQLAQVYRADWPEGLIRVDVSVFAGRVGGYTSLDPLHVTIASAEERNQGPAALEILFHEASHGLARAVADGIARECRSRGKPIPRDLWHAVLFYTTGEVVKRAFRPPSGSAPSAGDDYTPYAYRHGLYQRGAWRGSGYGPLLERHWQEYLDGKLDFDRAIARMVASL